MEGSSLKPTVERLGMRVRFSQDPIFMGSQANWLSRLPFTEKIAGSNPVLPNFWGYSGEGLPRGTVTAKVVGSSPTSPVGW